jgi:16S rRNA (cytidine1402-2'-O)-methyltransferase
MLYLVATPIGNLKDITLRALEVMKSVDLIACEDTRKSRVLLEHYGISKPLMSFFEHNEERAGRRIIAELQAGRSVALITDGGTPGISDPGYTIVQKAIDAGICFTLIPGPSALDMSVVLSGLPVHSFVFRGFPPQKPGARKRFLEQDRHLPHTLVYYESVHRIDRFLADALEVFGDRRACLCRELTKRHEEVERGTLSQLADLAGQKKRLGEYVVVIAGAPPEKYRDGSDGIDLTPSARPICNK